MSAFCELLHLVLTIRDVIVDGALSCSNMNKQQQQRKLDSLEDTEWLALFLKCFRLSYKQYFEFVMCYYVVRDEKIEKFVLV